MSYTVKFLPFAPKEGSVEHKICKLLMKEFELVYDVVRRAQTPYEETIFLFPCEIDGVKSYLGLCTKYPLHECLHEMQIPISKRENLGGAGAWDEWIFEAQELTRDNFTLKDCEASLI